MNLLVFSESFYPEISGGSLTRWEFCKQAVREGNKVTVITPRTANLPKKETVEGVEIRRPFKSIPESVPDYSSIAVVTRIFFSIFMFFYLILYLHKRNMDGIHSVSHSLHWVAKILSMIYGIPLVSFVGYTVSVDSSWKPTPKFILESVNFRFFLGDSVFCRTEDIKNKIDGSVKNVEIVHGILNKKKILNAYKELDKDFLRKALDINEKDIVLVYAGRLSELKRPWKAVEQLKNLPDKYKLIVVGEGPELNQTIRKSQNLDVYDRVRFTGQLPHKKTLKIIAFSDALILASESESYSAVALEKLAFGGHVFSTPVGILPKVDNHRLHLSNVNELSHKIYKTDLSGNTSIDQDILHSYSMERYTEAILDEFEKLCKNK